MLAQRRSRQLLASLVAVAAFASAAAAQPPPPSHGASSPATLAELIGGVRDKAKSLEATAGMRLGFHSFTSKFRLPARTYAGEDFRLSEHVRSRAY
jgi:hypothetical protein